MKWCHHNDQFKVFSLHPGGRCSVCCNQFLGDAEPDAGILCWGKKTDLLDQTSKSIWRTQEKLSTWIMIHIKKSKCCLCNSSLWDAFWDNHVSVEFQDINCSEHWLARGCDVPFGQCARDAALLTVSSQESTGLHCAHSSFTKYLRQHLPHACSASKRAVGVNSASLRFRQSKTWLQNTFRLAPVAMKMCLKGFFLMCQPGWVKSHFLIYLT